MVYQNKNQQLKLHGFNNLTKNFTCSAYFIHYIEGDNCQQNYNQQIVQPFTTKHLTVILTEICHIVGATILNIAQQEYQPHGSSVTLLIAESESMIQEKNIVCHLDKSHLCVHTYPEFHPTNGIATIRVDFEISTCGIISPLSALNFILDKLDADILTLDYRIRGFTRKKNGTKLYNDHKMKSIQQYINAIQRTRYEILDANMPENNLYSARLIKNRFNLDNYLLGTQTTLTHPAKIELILKQERKEIFYSKNL